MPNSKEVLFGTSLTLLLGSVSTIAFAQQEVIDLGTIYIRGEKINRAAEDAPPSITIIPGEVAEAPYNRDIDDVINGEANVLANEGFRPPAIRGVEGTAGVRPSITAGSQPRIPVLVDDVPLPSGEASNITQSSTWDIETVEVARGPQATSTGRNALGGAIRVYTRDPEFFREGAIRTTLSNQQEAGLDFMLNTPLIENQLAFRLTGELSNADSYISNNPNPVPSGFDPNEEETRRLRGKLLWEPTALPGFSLLVSAERGKIKGPTEGFFNGDIEDLTVNPPFTFSSAYEEVDQNIYTARATYDISDNATLVARYSQLDNDLRFLDTGEEIFPGATLGETRFDKDLQEVEVYLKFDQVGIINSGAFGVIHSKEDEVGSNDGAALSFDLTGSIENTGIYGEVELDASAVASGLSFIFGGRYEIDKRTRTTFDGAGNLAGTGSFDEDVFLPKIGVRYDLNAQSSIGYEYSEGFRGGGLDVDLSAPLSGSPFSTVAFGPERLKQHEIYVRTVLMNGALDLGASAFYYHWDDAQISGAATYPGSGDAAIGNIPEATGKGLEFSATYSATNALDVFGSVGLLDTEITKVDLGQESFLGLELPRAPGTTASLGLYYQANNGFDASLRASFVDSYFSGLNEEKLSAYTVVDLAIGYDLVFANGNNLRLDAFVENLFDERYRTFTEANAFGGLNQVGQPRTFGVSATMRF